MSVLNSTDVNTMTSERPAVGCRLPARRSQAHTGLTALPWPREGHMDTCTFSQVRDSNQTGTIISQCSFHHLGANQHLRRNRVTRQLPPKHSPTILLSWKQYLFQNVQISIFLPLVALLFPFTQRPFSTRLVTPDLSDKTDVIFL